ncbi:DoxX family protein [Halalkalicoccus tibetensis]|uniref:DoxX family protein n=1 Tax=Halalkalicoccus tibetensis TaxID=175632 RepID=A0ABD5V5M1_9EURY
MASDSLVPEAAAIVLQSTAFDAPLAAELFLIGRVLFGGVLAFNGLNHFLDADGMTQYADSKGVPRPRGAVLFTGGMLLFGGLGTVLGVAPILSVGALATFLLVATPIMHDFWKVPQGQQERELVHFMKNTTLLGATLLLLALGSVAWPYAL